MEHILTPKVENVKLLDKFNAKSSPMGTLYLTTTHLIFVSSNPDQEVKKEVWILHMLMQTVEKPNLTTSGTQIKISCSHFQTVSFIIQKDRDAHDVYMSLLALSKPKALTDLYCFSYNPKGELRQTTGWNFHDIQAEFQRQGVPNQFWSHCTLNANYELCPTYPKHLYVPAGASIQELEGSSKFRSRGRLPVLTYLHKNGCAIIRCAQPMVGISGMRSTLDESYVECLRKASPRRNNFIYVIDTRPAMNAMANRAGGKGYENEKYYENISFSFKGIENIHKMRNSLKQAITSVTESTTMDGYLGELSNSQWLKHIKAVLDCSFAIMMCIIDGKSVIVHCSDGWDRTSQTCALASLMLDGYYRTIQGFQALIEKDWLSFGHKFSDRCGHLDGDANEVSPNFMQFLDCTWQLMQQFPQAFQFNEKYLICIHEHVYSCQYGTFIGNCEREREEAGLRDKTYSLWGYLTANLDVYSNPLYNSATMADVIHPDCQAQNIRFWTGLYCRFEHGAHPREPVIDLLSITQSHTSSLEDHGRQLTKTLGTVTSLVTGSKMSGAFRKMIPSSPTKPSHLTAAATAALTTTTTTTASSGSSTSMSLSSTGLTATATEALPGMVASLGDATGPSLGDPLGATSSPVEVRGVAVSREVAADSEMEKMEKKLTDLKANLVEKCQSRFMPSLMMVQSLPLVQKTINMPAKSTTFHTPATNKDEECKEKIPDHENETAELCPVITKEQIEAELNSVAVEWKPLRNCHECPCGSPLEGTVNKKTHCRKCGNIFCTRCVRTKLELPGHMSKKSVPVCNACHKFLQGDMRASQSSQQAEATL